MRAYTSFAPCAMKSRCSSSAVFAVSFPSVYSTPFERAISMNGLTDRETRKSFVAVFCAKADMVRSTSIV